RSLLTATPTTGIYTLSLHDALPISNRANLAKLADPRTIGMNDAEADRIVSNVAPVYYITGTIHSTEAGAPTALMEMAYRLAVDRSEEHTSELQSRSDLVCRLLLEKK